MFGFLKRRHEAARAADQARLDRFRARYASPDFELIRLRYGKPISAPLRDLYSNLPELSKDCVTKIIPGKRSEEWLFFAWYEPLDRENLDSGWDADPKLYQFADDGLANRYAVDPTDADAEIFFMNHESGEIIPTGVRISELSSLAEQSDELDE